MKILYLLLFVSLASGARIVNTNCGPVRGVSVAGKKVKAYLGIPYAEPPVGDLRFAKPVPKSPWRRPYDANRLPTACIQAVVDFPFPIDIDPNMSEDCLFLNLWVPESYNDQKPIMVFIHGGSHFIGSSNWKLYDGAALSERGDVIVATINYRLGTLGFFSAFIDEAAGSMGMYDQVMAIQWIKDNARHFGGNPDNIVLFGESSGASAVSLHMISPLSKNLFRRSILQSGSAYHPIYADGNVVTSMGSQRVASILGCATSNESLEAHPKEIVDCMKRLPAKKFSEADLVFLNEGGVLVPRFGDDFLPENPIDLYQKGNSKRNEVLIGMNRNEGSLLLAGARPDIFGISGEKFDGRSFNETVATEMAQLVLAGDEGEILRSYFDRVKDGSGYTYLDAVIDIYGDNIITCCAVFLADYQSLKNSKVYFYVFDFRPPSTTLPEWMGVTHFEELPYVFGNPMYKAFTRYEKQFSKRIMDKWTNFAKTGNPRTSRGLIWPRYSFENPKYYILGRKEEVGVRPDEYRCEAWRKVFRAVIDDNVKNNSEKMYE